MSKHKSCYLKSIIWFFCKITYKNEKGIYNLIKLTNQLVWLKGSKSQQRGNKMSEIQIEEYIVATSVKNPKRVEKRRAENDR